MDGAEVPGLHPSPQLYDRFAERDQLLTNTSLYWFTRTAGTSSWPMYDSPAGGGNTWPRGQKKVPTGVYGGGSALMRRLADRTNTIVHRPDDSPAEHHFVAMNRPQAHVADIRAFFAKVR